MHQNFTDLLLEVITGDDYLYPRLFESGNHFTKRLQGYKKQQYDNAIWKLKNSGRIKTVIKNNKKFFQCTKKGQLEILLKKASTTAMGKWDGKWRLVIFDIPEAHREMRALFRQLLRRNNFVLLQASVFISPYSLNQEALLYLRETGLMDFVRILRVDAMDNDKQLKKKFNL